MPAWLNERRGVQGNPTVQTLLVEIQTLHNECLTELGNVFTTRDRCHLTPQGEITHANDQKHGPDDGTGRRHTAYDEVVGARDAMQAARDLLFSVVPGFLSHGGGGSTKKKLVKLLRELLERLDPGAEGSPAAKTKKKKKPSP